MSDMAPLSRDHVHGSPAEGAPMVVLYAPLVITPPEDSGFSEIATPT